MMTLGFVIGLVLLCLLLLGVTVRARPSRYASTPRSSGRGTSMKTSNAQSQVSVQVLVLGDIGHSPRMQYHARSVAKHGGRVSIVGYLGSPPNADLLSSPLVSIVPISAPPRFLNTTNKLLFPFFAFLKVIHQTCSLWNALLYRCDPAQWMLVQNPPAAPTLCLAQIACLLRNTRLVIDWHNFGYSILAMKLGTNHPAVTLMRRFEMFFCHFASAHFCVSNAMSRVLREEVGIKEPILVLHDRPASIFQPILSESDRCKSLRSLPVTSPSADAIIAGSCRLLVSSTSWTPDEDFSVLLDALCHYSRSASTDEPDLPSLLVIITGKGPQKELYLSKIADLVSSGRLAKVRIETAWLALEDYAKLLAVSSLGVCLHTSSSGVDLPMKVVDMFGAGLPVVGWNKYESWPELVTEGVNGKGFGSSRELALHLVGLFGKNSAQLTQLRQGAIAESGRRWDDEWDSVGGKLFQLAR